MTSDTAGLKCAPLTGPNTSIRMYSPPTVASVLASSAMATLPPARRSAMMPEPMTMASSNAVPSASAKQLARCVSHHGAQLLEMRVRACCSSASLIVSSGSCQQLQHPVADGLARQFEGVRLPSSPPGALEGSA